jgi:hypothetical protein
MSSGSGTKGDDGSDDVEDGKLSSPAVVDSHDSPKAILGLRHHCKMVSLSRVTPQPVL